MVVDFWCVLFCFFVFFFFFLTHYQTFILHHELALNISHASVRSTQSWRGRKRTTGPRPYSRLWPRLPRATDQQNGLKTSVSRVGTIISGNDIITNQNIRLCTYNVSQHEATLIKKEIKSAYKSSMHKTVKANKCSNNCTQACPR